MSAAAVDVRLRSIMRVSASITAGRLMILIVIEAVTVGEASLGLVVVGAVAAVVTRKKLMKICF